MRIFFIGNYDCFPSHIVMISLNRSPIHAIHKRSRYLAGETHKTKHRVDLIIENENNGNYEKTINNNYIFIGLLKLFIN